MRRAVKLAQLDMRLESIREWDHVVRGLDDDALLLAAEYARRAGLYDRAINTAERTPPRHDFALRYLMPFRTEFAAAAHEQGIDEALLFGIARQESRFVADIVSSAGAHGPDAADAGDRALGRETDDGAATYSPAQIAERRSEHAVRRVLFQVLARPARRLPALAAAAYNAGPAVRRHGGRRPARSKARSGSRRSRSTRRAIT